ncbi:MAG TPA: EamA family transporter [Candidatus Paceibacterota bacterium]|nr:EamA family transporter [Candidatus Paceibacterota bacterium]
MQTWFIFALAAPLLWAIVNHIDKYVITKLPAKAGVRGLLTFSAIFAIVIVVIARIMMQDGQFLSLFVKASLIVAGVVGTLAVYFYLKALEAAETSIVAPLMQFVPVFAYAMGIIFFNESFTLVQIVGAAIIILGAMVLSVDFRPRKEQFRKKVVGLMVVSSLFFAASQVLFKLVTIQDSFWIATYWQYIGIFLSGIVLIIIPAFRKDFLMIFRKGNNRFVLPNILIQVFTIGGNMATNYAVILAPIAMVMLVASYQPVFVFAIGILGAIFFPAYIKDSLKKGLLVQKIAAIAFILLGSYLLY